MINKCDTCALYSKDNGICRRTSLIEAPTHCCSHWCDTIPVCEVCGNQFIPLSTFVLCDNQYRTICQKCCDTLGRCPTCKYGRDCDFETNPIPIPPMVMATKQQGNMIMSSQVPNPERIKRTCAVNCKCYNETVCNKRCFGTCENYSFILDEEPTKEEIR